MNNDLKQQGSEFWNSNSCGGKWQNYREFMEWIRRTEPYFYQVLDQYDWKNKYVLEVGCGQGSTLNYLPPKGAKVWGVDMSRESITKAQAGSQELGHADSVKFSVADAEHLPFENEKFDAVICGGVLHHTENTEAGVQEIWRVLKPGGIAIVMLYRSGNPKWLVTKMLRGLSSIIDKITGKKYFIAEKLRARQKVGSEQGTALLELFGVPILKAFNNKQCIKMFELFNDVKITNYQPGFERNCDIISVLKPFKNTFRHIDTRMKDKWGFYQVIEARK